MTEIEVHAVNAARGARLDDEDVASAAAVGLAKWLWLAATPTFAIMGPADGFGREPDEQALLVRAWGTAVDMIGLC